MIRIFTDTSYITAENRRIIFPLLFDLCYLDNQNLKEYYRLTDSLEEAEIAIVPIDILYYYKRKNEKQLKAFLEAAHKLKKTIWIYSGGDYGITMTDDVYIFRLGGFNSQLNSKTFILPSFVSDPYDRILKKEFWVIPKPEKATIGFVGNADGSIVKWIKEAMLFIRYTGRRIIKKEYTDFQKFYPSGSKRFWLLNKLEKDTDIQTNFIFRKKYRAGVATEKDNDKTTLEFYQNMDENPYMFCLRGNGNFSVRFYETLIMGRIPVLIDTDVRLPLEEQIDWEKHCVRVSEKKLVEELKIFHANIKSGQFEDMQRTNRELALNLLSRENYFIKVSTIFTETSE